MPTGTKLVRFRGDKVIEGWPEKLANNQKWTQLISRRKGVSRTRTFMRIPFDGKVCHDCRAKKGELHVLGCGAEQCPNCKGQLISCDCFNINKDVARAAKVGLEL